MQWYEIIFWASIPFIVIGLTSGLFYLTHREWRKPTYEELEDEVRQLKEFSQKFSTFLMALADARGEIRIPDISQLRASHATIEQTYDVKTGETVFRVKEMKDAPAPR